MDDQDVLRHLLEIEAQASALVDDAQAEADRRIKECEEQNRARYEESYKKVIEELEIDYKTKTAEVKSAYQKELDGYRASLESIKVDEAAFNSLAANFLLGEKK
jgi:vacuolar-type H+-ATPase subunit H